MYAKWIRIVAPMLVFAGAAGLLAPYVFNIGPSTVRVIILSTGMALLISGFEVLGAVLLKRRVSARKIVLVFGASILFFSLTELFVDQMQLGILIPVTIAVFILACVIAVRRRVQNKKVEER